MKGKEQSFGVVVGTLKSLVGYRDLAGEVRRRESGIERMQVGLLGLGAKDLAQSLKAPYERREKSSQHGSCESNAVNIEEALTVTRIKTCAIYIRRLLILPEGQLQHSIKIGCYILT